MEHILGSDHRPVVAIFEVEKRCLPYLKLNFGKNDQGIGILKFSQIKLSNFNIPDIESFLCKKINYPAHLQLSFYGDYLETFVSTDERPLINIAQLYNPIEWDNPNELPKIFTPVNSLIHIRDRRLIILLWITND